MLALVVEISRGRVVRSVAKMLAQPISVDLELVKCAAPHSGRHERRIATVGPGAVVPVTQPEAVAVFRHVAAARACLLRVLVAEAYVRKFYFFCDDAQNREYLGVGNHVKGIAILHAGGRKVTVERDWRLMHRRAIVAVLVPTRQEPQLRHIVDIFKTSPFYFLALTPHLHQYLGDLFIAVQSERAVLPGVVRQRRAHLNGTPKAWRHSFPSGREPQLLLPINVGAEGKQDAPSTAPAGVQRVG